MDFHRLLGDDGKSYTLTQIWQSRRALNEFPLVVRRTDAAQFLVVHLYDRNKFIGICQGHSHLLEDEEIYRPATQMESEMLFVNLNVTPPREDEAKEPDALHRRWMHENGGRENLSMADHFASHALLGLIMNSHAMPRDEDTLAKKAYDLAEAMLHERSKRYTQ